MGKQDLKINLACYLIRFREKNSRKVNYMQLNEVLPNGFIDFIIDFTKKINKETHTSTDQERIFDLDKIDASNLSRNFVTGFFSKGLRGKGTEIKIKKDRKSIVIDRLDNSKYTADPYFFLFGIPSNKPNAKAGVLMAQSYKNYGFKEVFEEAFKKYVAKELGENIICDINILTNPVLFNKTIKKSGFKKLRYRKHSLPSSLDNIIDCKIENEIDRKFYDIELVISAKRKIEYLNINKKLEKVADDNTSFLELAPIDGFGFDEVYGDVIMGKYKRTINISNPNRFGAVYDISKDVSFESNGQLSFDSIKKVAINIFEDDILKNVNFT